METIILNHRQYMESITHIADLATHRFALQAESWWNRHFSWNKDGCRVLTDDSGEHLAYLFYKVDRYRDYLTIHNLFTPHVHRNNGYAFKMLNTLFLAQADLGVKRFRMSCTSGALGFYAKLSLIYWGIDTTGNYHCDLPLPNNGITGIADMVQNYSDRELLGGQLDAIYRKVRTNGDDFEKTRQNRLETDKKRLGIAYRHEKLILLHGEAAVL